MAGMQIRRDMGVDSGANPASFGSAAGANLLKGGNLGASSASGAQQSQQALEQYWEFMNQRNYIGAADYARAQGLPKYRIERALEELLEPNLGYGNSLSNVMERGRIITETYGVDGRGLALRAARNVLERRIFMGVYSQEGLVAFYRGDYPGIDLKAAGRMTHGLSLRSTAIASNFLMGPIAIRVVAQEAYELVRECASQRTRQEDMERIENDFLKLKMPGENGPEAYKRLMGEGGFGAAALLALDENLGAARMEGALVKLIASAIAKFGEDYAKEYVHELGKDFGVDGSALLAKAMKAAAE